MRVILISGKAQNGKDTVAKMICDSLCVDGYRTLITHYADLLKFICRNYFNWDGNKDESGRRLLQYIGTDVVRKRCPDLWVDFVIEMLKLFGDRWDYVIIPDCRFPNEIANIKENSFDAVHIRVNRPNFDSLLSDEQQHHESETALDQCVPDFYIENNGTIAQLTERINIWVKEALYEK